MIKKAETGNKKWIPWVVVAVFLVIFIAVVLTSE